MNLFKSLTRVFRRERSPGDLARWLGVPEPQLREWLTGKPAWALGYDYARFEIPKRRGGRRTIEAPNEKLKALQRTVLHRLLNPLPLHPAATGFRPGRSIVDNARPHVGQAVVINIDLADFFPAITAERVTESFRGLGWDAEAALILSRICTRDGHLPQGAPTSPAVSNLACRRLDARLAALAAHHQGRYTRYADDLTVSLPGLGRGGRDPSVSRRILAYLREVIEAEGFRIQLKKKVRVQRAHQRQTATGLVVNEQINLPRAVRRRIRAMQHRQRLGQLDAAGQQRLRGLEALAGMVARQRQAG